MGGQAIQRFSLFERLYELPPSLKVDDCKHDSCCVGMAFLAGYLSFSDGG